MYCENCGEQVAHDAKYCNKCGNKLAYNIRDPYVKQMDSKNGREVASKKKKSKLKKLIGTILFVLTIVVMVILIYSDDRSDEKEDINVPQNVSVTYPLQETACTTEETTVTKAVITTSEEFLITLQETLKNREHNVKPSSNELSSIYLDLYKLEKYLSKSFDDVRLKRIANDYIDGLHLQESAWVEHHLNQQIMWLEGLIKRYDAISELYKYGYCKFDNISDFEYVYIYQLDNHKEHCEALKAIKKDIHGQLSSHDWEPHHNYTMTHNYNNTTLYDFSAMFYISYKDRDGLIYESVEKYYDYIPASSSIELEFYLPLDELPEDNFYFDMQVDIHVSKFS